MLNAFARHTLTSKYDCPVFVTGLSMETKVHTPPPTKVILSVFCMRDLLFALRPLFGELCASSRFLRRHISSNQGGRVQLATVDARKLPLLGHTNITTTRFILCLRVNRFCDFEHVAATARTKDDNGLAWFNSRALVRWKWRQCDFN